MPDPATPSAQGTPPAAGAPAVPPATPPADAPKPSDAPKPGDTPKPEVKPGEEGKGEVPANYDLKPPKDSRLSTADIEGIVSYAKEHGLSQKQAEMLVERENAAASRFEAQQLEFLKAQPDVWLEAAKSDPEIGGDKLAENTEFAKRAIERFDGKDGTFAKALNETGLGNHKEILRFMSKVGRAMKDDKLVTTTTAAGGDRKKDKDVFYDATPDGEAKT